MVVADGDEVHGVGSAADVEVEVGVVEIGGRASVDGGTLEEEVHGAEG